MFVFSLSLIITEIPDTDKLFVTLLCNLDKCQTISIICTLYNYSFWLKSTYVLDLVLLSDKPCIDRRVCVDIDLGFVVAICLNYVIYVGCTYSIFWSDFYSVSTSLLPWQDPHAYDDTLKQAMYNAIWNCLFTVSQRKVNTAFVYFNHLSRVRDTRKLVNSPHLFCVIPLLVREMAPLKMDYILCMAFWGLMKVSKGNKDVLKCWPVFENL